MKTSKSINSRVKIQLLIALLILFSLIGGFFYNEQRNLILQMSERQIRSQLDDLCDIMDFQIISKQKIIENYLNFTLSTFNKNYLLKELDTQQVKIVATDQFTQINHVASLNQWLLNEKQVYQNYDFVDFIHEKSKVTATIFQRFDKGFLRISTCVLKKNGERATGTYIPNHSPVAKALSSNLIYTGRAFVVDNWYRTAYAPIKINNEVKGALYVGEKELDYDILSNIFATKKYLKTGYPFLISQKGNLLIHPNKEQANIERKIFAENIKNSKSDFFELKKADEQTSIIYFKEVSQISGYVCISVYKEELLSGLNKLLINIITISILSIFVFYLISTRILRTITRLTNELRRTLKLLSEGKKVQLIDYNDKDEFGTIVKYTNQLITSNQNIANFSQEIGKGNFDANLMLLSNEDEISKALLDMRQSLKESKDKEEKIKERDKIIRWQTEGISKLSSILRLDDSNLENIGRDIITFIAKYLDANQSAIYIINDSDPNDIYIENISIFAYNKKRQLEKRIELEEGIIGRCIDEGNPIYMTDIPKSYMKITSGLGGYTPNNLIVVPIKKGNEILGAIEIASFRLFNEHEKDFLYMAAENIGMTIFNIKINLRTEQILGNKKVH